MLSQIAIRDSVYDNRVLAISLISDEKFLIHIGANGKSFDEKMLAIRMIEQGNSTAILRYRNGTTELDRDEGYYTG